MLENGDDLQEWIWMKKTRKREEDLCKIEDVIKQQSSSLSNRSVEHRISIPVPIPTRLLCLTSNVKGKEYHLFREEDFSPVLWSKNLSEERSTNRSSGQLLVRCL